MRTLAWLPLALAPLFVGSASAAPMMDAAGRGFDIAAPPVRLLPAGPPAQVLLYALEPEHMLGLVEGWSAAQKAVAPDAYKSLPTVPRLTGHPSDADLAAIKALHPDFVLDFGDVNPSYIKLADSYQASIGAPYALFDDSLDKTPAEVRTLGAMLGATERAEKIASAMKKGLALLADVRKLPGDQRIGVYYARGADGLRTIRPGSSLAIGVEYAGAKLLAPDVRGKGAFIDATVDQVVALKPQVVVLADPKAAEADSPLRKALPPDTRFLVDRGLPFHAMEDPPSVNQLVGALALAETLYPDKAKGGAQMAIDLNALLFPGAPTTPVLGP